MTDHDPELQGVTLLDDAPMPTAADDGTADAAQEHTAPDRDDLTAVAVEEQWERDTLAARVHAATPATAPAPSAEAYVRTCHEQSVTRLAERRAQRDSINEMIRLEVEHEEVLGRAVAVFDRARERRVADDA